MLEALRSPKKTKVFCGANRSGKTLTGVFEAIMVYTGIIPPSLQGVYPYVLPRRSRKVKIIVQDYTKHWPLTIRPMLLGDPDKGMEGMLPLAWSDFDEEEHIFYGPDGSMLSIDAVDPREDVDPNRLRGPGLDHTLIDERTVRAAYTESLLRGSALKDGPRTVTLCFCPQDGLEDWTYTDFYLTNFDGVTDERLAEKESHPDIHVECVDMRDNPGITAQEIEKVTASLKPWEVAYRVHGRYSQRAANAYFDMDQLLKWQTEHRTSEGIAVRLNVQKQDTDAGVFLAALELPDKFDETLEPVWRVWKTPEPGHKYCLAADAAEGNVESDFQEASVWDCTAVDKIHQVAQLHIRTLKAGEFGVQCACLATLYGKCMIVPEAQSVGGGMFIDRIRNYPNLYHRITVGKDEEIETDKLGWHTNDSTKGPMLELLYKTLGHMAAQGHCPVRSRFTLVELMAYEERVIRRGFNQTVQVIWAAKRHQHDDCVMEMAIAFKVAIHENDKLLSLRLKPVVVDSPELTEMEKKAGVMAGERRPFAGLKKKPSLGLLRRMGYGPRGTVGIHG